MKLAWQTFTRVLCSRNNPESYMAEMPQRLRRWLRCMYIQSVKALLGKQLLPDLSNTTLVRNNQPRKTLTKWYWHWRVNIPKEKQWEQEDGTRPSCAHSTLFLNQTIGQNPILTHHNLYTNLKSRHGNDLKLDRVGRLITHPPPTSSISLSKKKRQDKK